MIVITVAVAMIVMTMVVVITMVVLERPEDMLEHPLGYMTALFSRRLIREAEVNPLIDTDVDHVLCCV
jgi:hypothetical protein